MRRTKRGGWPYSQPANVPFEINRDSPQSDGLVLWMPWGGGTIGAHSRHVGRVSGLVFTEVGAPVWVADGKRGWSLLFDDGVPDYLYMGSPVLSGVPISMTCWFNSDDATVNQTMIGISSEDVTYNGFWLTVRGNVAGDLLHARCYNGALGSAATTSGYSINTWHHGVAVFAANNDRRAYLDGGNKGTDAAAVTPAGLDNTTIGAIRYLGPAVVITSGPFSGYVTDIRIYNRILTDTEVWQHYVEPWELWKPLIRRWAGWKSPVPPPVGGHMTLWGRYWGP